MSNFNLNSRCLEDIFIWDSYFMQYQSLDLLKMIRNPICVFSHSICISPLWRFHVTYKCIYILHVIRIHEENKRLRKLLTFNIKSSKRYIKYKKVKLHNFLVISTFKNNWSISSIIKSDGSTHKFYTLNK